VDPINMGHSFLWQIFPNRANQFAINILWPPEPDQICSICRR